MNNKSEKPSFWEKFKKKYRFAVYMDETYEEVLNLKLTRLNFILLISAAIALFVLFVVFTDFFFLSFGPLVCFFLTGFLLFFMGTPLG